MDHYHEILNQIVFKVNDVIEGMSELEMDSKRDENKWSKKEILGHLIDSAYNNHQRFLSAQGKDNLIFSGYDQELWVKQNQYQERDKEEILITWEIVHNHLEHTIRAISVEIMLRQTSDHNFDSICMKPLQIGELTSLSYLIWDYLFHLEHHLTQIVPGYQKILPEFES